MSNLRPVSRRELVRRMRALGFEGPYQEGKHPFWFETRSVCQFRIHMRETSELIF